MGNIGLGVNMEYVRHDDKNFEGGVGKTAELGLVNNDQPLVFTSPTVFFVGIFAKLFSGILE